MICKTLFDLPMTMKQNRKFDFLFIDDLMPIIDYFIMHDARHTEYNITPDQSVELLEVARLVRKISNKDLPIVVAKEGMNLEYSGDNARLKSEIGNVKFTPLEQSVSLLYDWYSQNKNRLDINKLLTDK
jgi:UDP-glucose 4-epimerase